MISMRVLSFLKELEGLAITVTNAMTCKVLCGIYLSLDQSKLSKLTAEQDCIYHLQNGTEVVLR